MGLFDFFKKDTLKHYSKVDTDTLKCFMLNGARYVWGYGGYSEFETEVMNYARANKEKTINYYKHSFYFPFKREQAQDHIDLLSNFWEIPNKESIEPRLQEIKNEVYSFSKAYYIATVIQVTCLAYAAKYYSEKEAVEIIKNMMPLAKQHFHSWEEYFENFKQGIQKTHSAHWANQYCSAATLMLEGQYSIYKIIKF